jgi:hypothetical protein
MIRMMFSLLIALAAASNTFAGDRSQAFGDTDIRGNYGLLAQGSSVVPGTQIAFPAVIVGRLFSDGKGNLQGTGIVNPGGPVSGIGPGQSVTITGTYDVDTDGTGDFTASAAAASPSATSKKQRPPSAGFSNATLRGAWGFACHGALVSSTGDPTAVESPVAVVGLMTNDGRGKFSAEVTSNTNGVVNQENFTGVNSVASDGTISATATSTDPLLANLQRVVDNAREFRVITTDAGTIVSCTFTVQGRPDEEER